MNAIGSPGKHLSSKLLDAIQEFSLRPELAALGRPIIHGITSKGECLGDMTMEKFLRKAGQVALESEQVFRYGNALVLENQSGVNKKLTVLANDQKADSNAAAMLANLFWVSAGSGESSIPQRLAATLLANNVIWNAMPEIKQYSRRIMFNAEFQVQRPGWNSDSGILVHGEEIVPVPYTAESRSDDALINRLPPRLRDLLAGFCWKSDQDLANAVAFLLTGLLVNHFVDQPHPIALIDGNQPGVGKTLLAQLVGQLLDREDPPRVTLSTNDEELEKRLCAAIRNPRSSVLLLDNVRTQIESGVLERCVLSPILSFRILKTSEAIDRPNVYLWAITCNGTQASPDLIDRSIVIRLEHSGDPKKRQFRTDPLEYVADHRREILGELAGMVVTWVQHGKPMGHHQHRCRRWAAVIGGIFSSCGMGNEFLANADETLAEFDQGLSDLAALAEQAVLRLDGFAVNVGTSQESAGKTPREWVPIFSQAQVLSQDLRSANDRGRTTWIGKFLTTMADRTVRIEVNGEPRMATLQRRKGRSNKSWYWIELSQAQTASGLPDSQESLTGQPTLIPQTILNAPVGMAVETISSSVPPGADLALDWLGCPQDG